MKFKQKNYHAILVMIKEYVDFAEKEFKKQNKQIENEQTQLKFETK